LILIWTNVSGLKNRVLATVAGKPPVKEINPTNDRFKGRF